MNSLFDPMVVYYPKDSLSQELFKSIPKKVNLWLEGLNVPCHGTGSYGKLRWNFDIENSSLIYSDADAEPQEYVQLWWDVEAKDGVTMCGSSAEFESLSSNLKFFTALEKNIYDELEKFQLEIEKDYKENEAE